MGGKNIDERHTNTKLHVSKALQDCFNLAFPDWNKCIPDWDTSFPTSNIPECNRYITHTLLPYNVIFQCLTTDQNIPLNHSFDSAFHVLNYMRNWDGTRLVNNMPMVCIPN
jgi:hypothetical protein